MNTAKALDAFVEKRSHVAVWNWVQLFNPNKFYLKRTRVTAFIIGVTMLQIGSDYAWLWVAAEPVHKQILGVYTSRHRNMLVAESFLRTLIKIYVNILYIQIEVPGIHRHVLLLVLDTY